MFLGVRLQCASCHNHPFDRWTQDDYHGFAAFFAPDRLPRPGEQPARRPRQARVRRRADRLPEPRRRDDATRARSGRRRRGSSARRRRTSAPTATGCGAGRLGRGAGQPVLRAGAGQPRLVSPDGPRARRAERRLPRVQPAVEPGRCSTSWRSDFAAGGFDLKPLVRTIMTSRTYQLVVDRPRHAHDERRPALLARRWSSRWRRSNCSTRWRR